MLQLHKEKRYRAQEFLTNGSNIICQINISAVLLQLTHSYLISPISFFYEGSRAIKVILSVNAVITITKCRTDFQPPRHFDTEQSHKTV